MSGTPAGGGAGASSSSSSTPSTPISQVAAPLDALPNTEMRKTLPIASIIRQPHFKALSDATRQLLLRLGFTFKDKAITSPMIDDSFLAPASKDGESLERQFAFILAGHLARTGAEVVLVDGQTRKYRKVTFAPYAENVKITKVSSLACEATTHRALAAQLKKHFGTDGKQIIVYAPLEKSITADIWFFCPVGAAGRTTPLSGYIQLKWQQSITNSLHFVGEFAKSGSNGLEGDHLATFHGALFDTAKGGTGSGGDAAVGGGGAAAGGAGAADVESHFMNIIVVHRDPLSLYNYEDRYAVRAHVSKKDKLRENRTLLDQSEIVTKNMAMFGGLLLGLEFSVKFGASAGFQTHSAAHYLIKGRRVLDETIGPTTRAAISPEEINELEKRHHTILIHRQPDGNFRSDDVKIPRDMTGMKADKAVEALAALHADVAQNDGISKGMQEKLIEFEKIAVKLNEEAAKKKKKKKNTKENDQKDKEDENENNDENDSEEESDDSSDSSSSSSSSRTE